MILYVAAHSWIPDVKPGGAALDAGIAYPLAGASPRDAQPRSIETLGHLSFCPDLNLIRSRKHPGMSRFSESLEGANLIRVHQGQTNFLQASAQAVLAVWRNVKGEAEA